jgi:antirestriction protein ArdC
MTSAFVCASLGIVPTVRHADYLGSWLEVLREDNRAIVRAASAASKAADFLLAFRPESEEPDVTAAAVDEQEAA